MAGRGTARIANAIDRLIAEMAQERQNRAQPVNEELRKLDLFEKRNPPRFKGGYDPEGAQDWLQGTEKIFRLMGCDEADKVALAVSTLSGEAESWWDGQRTRYETEGLEISWTLFQESFLGRYFPEDIREKKEVEFLTLVQGNMSVAEYAAKFEELSRFHPIYHNAPDDHSQCIKFASGWST